MTKQNGSKMVVVLTADRNAAKSLLLAMSKAGFIGTSPVLENLEEWKALPNREFFWAIVDTESLGDAPASVSFLHNFQVCLLFNCRRNEALVNEILARLRAVSPQMIVHTEAYSLTGDLFSENY